MEPPPECPQETPALTEAAAEFLSLIAYVTPQLETLEQEELEQVEVTGVVTLKARPVERRTHMVSHQHGITVTKTLREGEEETQRWSFSYSKAELQGLLPEGASLLLLRVLACQRAVPSGLVFPAIDTEGHLCTSSYCALGIQQQVVGSVEAEVFVIERAVVTGTGISTVWHSSFLRSGVKPRTPFPKQPLDWEEDIQLYSWFLDRKV
ncbi:ciliogenesis-associated TTC17-interacting protein [Grus japonensis]|uniref:Ciliogenesis-associated TTC17-interacting protein n=1 Tax=Grus japonensis TaxID=30415 RepID=A0ABC9X2J3_GRUJA